MFHNKKNVDHKETQFKAWIEHPTENHVYMGNKHHDEANMGCNQSIVAQNLFLSFGPRPYEQ
jgi:hypothetical protein